MLSLDDLDMLYVNACATRPGEEHIAAAAIAMLKSEIVALLANAKYQEHSQIIQRPEYEAACKAEAESLRARAQYVMALLTMQADPRLKTDLPGRDVQQILERASAVPAAGGAG